MAGHGSDGCGVGARHSFAELREVASEECPTGITELGVQPAHYVVTHTHTTIAGALTDASVKWRIKAAAAPRLIA